MQLEDCFNIVAPNFAFCFIYTRVLGVAADLKIFNYETDLDTAI